MKELIKKVSVKCQKCDKEIVGFHKNNVLANLEIHLAIKHRKGKNGTNKN